MEGSSREVVDYINVNKVMDTDPIEQNIRYCNMAFGGKPFNDTFEYGSLGESDLGGTITVTCPPCPGSQSSAASGHHCSRGLGGS